MGYSRYLWRLCWRDAEWWIKALDVLSVLGPGLLPLMGLSIPWWGWVLVSVFAVLAIIAGCASRRAINLEKLFVPKLQISYRVYNNIAQLVVQNVSGTTIDNVEVKLANYRRGDGSGIIDVMYHPKSTDGRRSPMSLNPGDPQYFSFARNEIYNNHVCICLLRNDGDWHPTLESRLGVKFRVTAKDINIGRIDFLLTILPNDLLGIGVWDPDRQPLSHIRSWDQIENAT